MLAAKDVATNIAVKDLPKATKFYEETLGLEKVGKGDDNVSKFKSGNSTIYVYKSDYAGSNKATTLTWSVGDDLKKTVDALKAKGVQFEHYDFPGMKREGEIHGQEGMEIAWFKDPDGNILAMTKG